MGVESFLAQHDHRDPRRGRKVQRTSGGEAVASTSAGRGAATSCLSDGQVPRGTVQGYLLDANMSVRLRNCWWLMVDGFGA